MTQVSSAGKSTKDDPVRLTQLSSCAGCAAKLNQTILSQVLKQLPRKKRGGDRNVLVGSDTFDDAGVYRLSRDVALVQTVDFFTPIVDDAFDFGVIAATNALSDIYAMGGRPMSALNLLGVPADKVGPETIADILRGGTAKAAEAKCPIIGGHTIRLPEPVYGLSVTGIVSPGKILANDRARPGDLLVLTKPLGVGIATTAIKRGLASDDLARRAVRSMKQLNSAGAELAERGLVTAATDVTGFGLVGHLGNVVRASSVGAELTAGAAPMLSEEVLALIDQGCIPAGSTANATAAEAIVSWNDVTPALRVLLTDAQTSGGLLLCVPPKNLPDVKKILRKHRTLAAEVIGRIVKSSTPRIVVHS